MYVKDVLLGSSEYAIRVMELVSFLLRGTCCRCVSVCLSVRPSVCPSQADTVPKRQTKTAKRRITRTTRYDSYGTPVFCS